MGQIVSSFKSTPAKIFRRRSLAKAITWGIIGTFDTILLS